MASASLGCCCCHFEVNKTPQSRLAEDSVLTERNVMFSEMYILRKCVFIQVGMCLG